MAIQSLVEFVVVISVVNNQNVVIRWPGGAYPGNV